MDNESLPYTGHQQVKDLIASNNVEKLASLRQDYMDYFAQNQCEPIGGGGWNELGQYFLGLAIMGSHGMRQTRQQFEAATAGMLKQPIPAWITTVEYVQTDLNGIYYLALPPQDLARQASIHATNPAAKDTDYVVPPIYQGLKPNLSPEQILNTRICDYVISHCG
ncbi:hypothetical protein [Phreatobacter stygius]|uniref:Uncharacterized protein n=1 Tax=Phreatobacter stygius TaxID=1940610 RepID=A0A4D7BLD3_9HYPH|nr:hypothetical protein [Phreatobacter stygius]QCI68537.1 hypothetical protein E8M01_32495 [Phreatobacter stygius]